MEKNSEKIIARLFLLGNTISNTTEGVYDGSYNISQIVGSSGVNQAYSYDIDFVSDEKIDISDILDIDVKIKLRDENSTSKREI
ncbi:hypothetical protein [Halarcobacter sp.]|uniref:hypothetical protein n=1 Tax=Halarcobacter sp. TaxID=2321133 RepID=UPI0029F5032F|nr:hypothetical protein [Halarcobacter sp.]